MTETCLRWEGPTPAKWSRPLGLRRPRCDERQPRLGGRVVAARRCPLEDDRRPLHKPERSRTTGPRLGPVVSLPGAETPKVTGGTLPSLEDGRVWVWVIAPPDQRHSFGRSEQTI